MAGSLNKVTLLGNLTKAPEIKTFGNGGMVANFTLATSDQWKDKTTGERKERTEFHRVNVTNTHLVTLCENYLRKGSKIWLDGALETRKYTDKDGVEKYTTEVVLRPYRGEILLLDKKGSTPSAQEELPVATPAPKTVDDMNDEIPF